MTRGARTILAAILAGLALSWSMPIAAPAETPGAPGVIRGSLVDAIGQPLAGYRVKGTDASGIVYQSEPTGADGKFEITGLPAGYYTYTILNPEGLVVAMKIPPMNLEPGTMITQPIA